MTGSHAASRQSLAVVKNCSAASGSSRHAGNAQSISGSPWFDPDSNGWSASRCTLRALPAELFGCRVPGSLPVPSAAAAGLFCSLLRTVVVGTVGVVARPAALVVSSLDGSVLIVTTLSTSVTRAANVATPRRLVGRRDVAGGRWVMLHLSEWRLWSGGNDTGRWEGSPAVACSPRPDAAGVWHQWATGPGQL